jgi:hypothetical protein
MVKFMQCANMQFCFKLGKTSVEMHKIVVTAYGSDAVTKNTVFKWCHVDAIFDMEGIVHSEFGNS